MNTNREARSEKREPTPSLDRAILFAVDLSEFEDSLRDEAPPLGISGALEALWHERRGNWDRAHEIAQDIAASEGAWVHAYLHRREGDQPNAEYWYGQARKPIASGELDEEWRAIVEALLMRL